jgi:hypothetical protein
MDEKGCIKMNSTIDDIIRNAKEAASVWSRFINKLDTRIDPNAFRSYFHLRPTSSGITIVTTSPYAPMRGLRVPAAELESVLQKIVNSYDSLASTGRETVRERFAGLGFKSRSSESVREENIQARMIRGMILQRPQYENIQFVASELTIKREHRFDIVGIKDGVLYIFEMKNIRSTKALNQAGRYLDHISEREKDFKALLQEYPGGPFAFSKVQGISVGPFAENTSLRGYSDYWLFEDGLDFYK